LLVFEGEPKFLRKFRVAAYQAAQAFGDIGTVFVSLRPLKFRSELELETHADLQKMLGEELTCGVGDWKFVGTVESVETMTQANVFQIGIRDVLAKLDKIYSSQVFTDQTLGDIVAELMPPRVNYEFLGGCDSYRFRIAIRYEESTFDFLKRLMQEVGGQIWCSGGVVYLGTAPSDESVTLRLGRDITGFSIRTGLGPESVAVDSVPYADKNTVQRSEVEMTSKKWGDVQAAAIDLRKKHDETKSFHIVHEDAGYEDTGQLAQRFLRAQASGRFFLTGVIRVPVPLGTKLSVENFQPANQEKGLSEKTLIEETVVTRFVGVGDPSGTEDRWEIEAENPESILDLDDHVPDRLVTSTAIVEDADDPMKMNRVRVYFPWDATQNSTPWLRVATPSWGADHAHYIPPKPGDTVLVSWGLRDVDPVVLASVSAGDELDLSGEVMVLKTVEGHTVTVGKNNIKIVNEAEGGGTELEILPDQLVVKTKNGQEVTIGSDSLKLDSGSGSTIEVQSSKIVISAAEIEISSTGGGAVKISGPQVSINNGALEVV
jgi:hypothetical protein